MTREIKTIYQYIYGNWYTMITYVYAELAIADHLHRSPKTVQELARLTGTVSEALHRVLRCATALGFHEHDPHTGRLTLTPLGRLLTSRGEVSMRAAARLNGADYRYGPWGNLLDYVRSGSGQDVSPAWERGSLDYLYDKPECLDIFEQAMTDVSQTTYAQVNEDEIIAQGLDLSWCTQVMDIGCGNGSLLQAVLQEHAHVQGALLDLPAVLDQVPLSPESHPVHRRMTKIPENFYTAVPGGYDLYLMKNVLHNHHEQRVEHLLTNIRQAILASSAESGSGSAKRLLLLEMIRPEDEISAPVSAFTDLNLNLLVGGTIRSVTEYRTLLHKKGFELLAVQDLHPLERKLIWAALSA